MPGSHSQILMLSPVKHTKAILCSTAQIHRWS